ncbi:hypothetical protein Tco_1397165 [Tanacetum coccineum]
MSTANQQTLTESGTEGRPLILKKGNYVPWAKIDDPNNVRKKIYEPIKDLSTEDRDQYNAHIKIYARYKLKPAGKALEAEFDQFTTEAGESLTSVYERFSILVNDMDQNKVKLKEIAINTKFINSLQPDELHVNASRGKKDARNHDILVLVVNSYANPLYSHASPSYSCSPQPYYGTHPSSVHDYNDDYQGEIQGDAKEDKLSTAMMLLA